MIRLASYNIRKAVGLDWRRDPMRVARVIAGLGADLVALQEADRRFGPRTPALTPEALRATGLAAVDPGPGPSLGWHGNAILHGPDLRLQEVRRIDLPGLEPRGALIAEFGTPDGPLTLCATHLGLLRRHRRVQLAALASALPEGTGPVLVAGDLNEWSAQERFAPLGTRMRCVSPGRSFHAARPVAALDRVFVGSDWTVEDSGVARTGEARRASDHLPIWVDLRRA